MRAPLLALLALTFAPPAMALPQAPTPASAGTAQTAQIALLLLPDSMMRGQVGQSFHKGFSEALAKDPSSQAMEQKYPGVLAAGEAAGLKAVTGALQEDLPKLRANIAGMLAGQLQPGEQAGMLTFLQTPTGHHLVDMGDQIYDASKLAKSMGDDPTSAHLTQQDVAGAVNPGFVGKLSNDDIRAMVAFANTPAGRKMKAVTPMIQQTTATWLNGFLASRTQDVQTDVMIAVRDYVAKAQAAAH